MAPANALPVQSSAPMQLRTMTADELRLRLERLLSRISLANAGPREVAALARSLAVIPGVKTRLAQTGSARLSDSLIRAKRLWA